MTDQVPPSTGDTIGWMGVRLGTWWRGAADTKTVPHFYVVDLVTINGVAYVKLGDTLAKKGREEPRKIPLVHFIATYRPA